MAILITGGAGFIGSATAVSLLQRGDDVVLLDAFQPLLYDRATKERNLAWVRQHGEPVFIEGDLRDEALLGELFERHRIEGVIHLAALAGVRHSIELPDLYADINITATARLMRVAMGAGVRRFALASSSSVYAMNTRTPFREDDHLPGQVSPYGASKFAMEALVQTLHHLADPAIDVAALRYFTVYGPRQRPDMAFHKFFTRLAAGQPIPMFGDGDSGRDYTFIDDIVAGTIAALDRVRGYRVYNLGGEEVHRLREVIQTMGEVAGVTPQIERLPMQAGDVFITSADVARARDELGYAPTTPLRDGLEKMWVWFQQERATD